MNVILQVARTELLEHRRQRGMMVVQVLNYLVWVVGFGVAFAAVQSAVTQYEPGQLEALLGTSLSTLTTMLEHTYYSMLFTNLPLYVAVLSGYSVLNDRERGTLPFLMLAPLTRRQLLVGKLFGAMAIPLALHLTLVPAFTLPLLAFPDLTDGALGTPAWWVSLLLGAPASAALVGSLGTLISALSRDVRTSMQVTSFFIGLLSLGIGAVLVDALSWGLGLQLAFAAVCLTVAVIILGVGAQVISRDVQT